MKKIAFICISLAFPFLQAETSFAQEWKSISNQNVQDDLRKIKPNNYHLVQINNESLQHILWNLKPNRDNTQIISIPNPNGGYDEFYIWESSIMEDELQSKFSHIRTYSGIKKENPLITAKFDFTEFGFHGIVFEEENTYYIDPLYYFKGNEYQVYYKTEFSSEKIIHPCLVDGTVDAEDTRMIEIMPDYEGSITPLRNHGSLRKQYRLALSCTGEYAQAVTGSSSPTKAMVLSAMVTTMNRVNGIYEKEVSVRMVLIANNDNIIYTSPASDPYTANNNGFLLMSQNQSNLSSVIGLSNFDIGHIFSTGGGGIASLASVCVNSQKARGVTGSDAPYGDPYDVDYVAHEMGHQFGANHTFNNCDGNENNSTAYEPGSGSTIMSYAGLCGGSNNLQNNSHDYFHNASLNEISRYISGDSHGGTGTCGVATTGSSNITLPNITATYNIPMNTPFEVTSPTATWSESSSLTYIWEEHDLGQVGRNENIGATATTAPVFRSYKSTTAGKYRSFPHADSVHRNVYNFRGERFPTVSRTIKTKVIVRGIDGDGYGSFLISPNVVTVNIVNGADAFVVTSPNAGSEIFTTGASELITWNIGGSTTSPINASTVDILLSIDGGKTYPYTLATDVPNTGSANVTIPSGTATTKARIKVKGHENVFYDVSNNDFTIKNSTSSLNSLNTIDFAIYPNPGENILNIEYDRLHEVNTIIIYNVLGQEVMNLQNSIKSTIDISKLPSGHYTIKIVNDYLNHQGVKSFIKK